MDIDEIYAEIIERLNDKVTNATIVETGVEGFGVTETSSGFFDPYVVVSIGGPIEAAKGRHITNRRYNVLKSWVIATVVAPVNSDALKIKTQVIDALWGFAPAGANGIELTGGTAQSVANEQSKPTKYMHTAMFSITHNLSGMVE